MKKIVFLILAFFIVSPSSVFAQGDNIQMTLTPPLMKNNMNPGESWMTTVKLVNNNKTSLIVYAHVQDFRSSHDGKVDLIPVEESEGEENKTGFLRQWIEIQNGPYEIKPFSSVEIPFNIDIPENAEPGGHYAAILVGTEPSKNIEGSGMGISSKI